MVRIVLDPDDVNQDEVVTLTDGRAVRIEDADRAANGRISRQLARFASVYADAYRAADPGVAEQVARGEVDVSELSPLHAAVRRRHHELRDEPGRGAQDVDPTALLDGRRWATGSGAVKALDQLTPSHRRNLLAWLERHSAELEQVARERLPQEAWRLVRPADPWVAGTPLHRALSALDAATDPTELAMDEARQVARRIQYEATGRWPAE